MFSIGVAGVSLYWTFGDGKLRKQQLAHILIHLWMFILSGLMVGFIVGLLV